MTWNQPESPETLLVFYWQYAHAITQIESTVYTLEQNSSTWASHWSRFLRRIWYCTPWLRTCDEGIAPSPTSSNGGNKCVYVQEVNVITSKDPAHAFKSMPEFTHLSYGCWKYRYCKTTVELDFPLPQSYSCRKRWLPMVTIFADR